MKRISAALAAMFVASMLTAGSAHAVTPGPEMVPASSDELVLGTDASDPIRTKSITKQVDCGGTLCDATMTTNISVPGKVSAAQIQADPALDPAQKTEMLSSLYGGHIIYYTTYWQRVQSRFNGLLWYAQHEGGYYFDGKIVWSKHRNWGVVGYHSCKDTRGAGFAVTVLSCNERNRPDLSPTAISAYEDFDVSALYKGVPIHDVKHQWINLYPSGAGYMHWRN